VLFHNEPISIGESVYEINFGAGVVVFICESTQRIQVRFGTREYTFNHEGRRHENVGKTLFWHDPVGKFIPMKDINLWKMFCRIRDCVMAIFFENRGV